MGTYFHSFKRKIHLVLAYTDHQQPTKLTLYNAFVSNQSSFLDYSAFIPFGYSSGIEEPMALLPLGFRGKGGIILAFQDLYHLCSGSLLRFLYRWSQLLGGSVALGVWELVPPVPTWCCTTFSKHLTLSVKTPGSILWLRNSPFSREEVQETGEVSCDAKATQLFDKDLLSLYNMPGPFLQGSTI